MLIKRLLQVNPEHRIDMKGIKSDLWFNQSQQEIYPGILVGYDKIVVDRKILRQLKTFKYDTMRA